LVVIERAIYETPGHMITALQLIFSPFETWEKVTSTPRGFLWVLSMHLLPLLVICLGIEGFLLHQLGEKQGELDYLVKVPVNLAVRYTVAYGVLLIAGVFICAKFLNLAAQSFDTRTTYFQSWLVMVYGFGPIILARMIDGIPQINTWVCWAIGVAVAASVLYHGIGMVLRPDQTKGFGLYLMAVIIIVVVSGAVHFVALSVLHGKLLRPRTGASELLHLGALSSHPVQGPLHDPARLFEDAPGFLFTHLS
jgi:hypothetical protein